MTNRTPLEDVEFLARSSHRVDVLRTLTSGPSTRADLHDETGISQPTLGRALQSLQERGWIESSGGEYALTAVGEFVTAGFVELLDSVETVQHLDAAFEHLPTDRMDFDLRAFADARILTPEPSDPFRHVRRVEELVYGADHLRLLNDVLPPGTTDDHSNRFEDYADSDRVVEAVVTAGTLDQSLEESDVAEFFEEVLALDRLDIYRYEGEIPLMVGNADGTAFLVPKDVEGVPAALIETEHDAVRSWVDALIDEHLAAATKVTADEVSP